MAATYLAQRRAGNVMLAIAGVSLTLIWVHVMLWIQAHGEPPPYAPLVLHVGAVVGMTLVGMQLRITAGRTYVGRGRWLTLAIAATVTAVALRVVADYHWTLQVAYGAGLAWLVVVTVGSLVVAGRRARLERARSAALAPAARDGSRFVNADMPILDASDDALGRMDLVRVLAPRLAAYDGKRSLVVGLCGPWGSGKTSFVRMLLAETERLAEESGRTVLGPVHLVPFALAGVDDLAPVVLQEIGRRIKANPRCDDLDIDVGEQVVDVATTLASSLTVVRADTQIMTGEYMLGDAVRAAMAWVKGHTGEETLDEASARVSAILRQSGALLLVSLDDVDRLSAVQLASIGRVINTVGGFENTVYVISLDRERVERTLEAQFGGGNAVLERTLHLAFDLPAPDPAALRDMIVGKIDVLRAARPWLTIDIDRLRVLWERALSSLVHTGRDVGRIIASYDLALDAVGDRTDPVDLFALEALRVLETKAHRELARHPTLDAEARSGVLAATSDRHRDAVRALVDLVFSGVPVPNGAGTAAAFPHYFRWSRTSETSSA
jgi:hypothetical protein